MYNYLIDKRAGLGKITLACKVYKYVIAGFAGLVRVQTLGCIV